MKERINYYSLHKKEIQKQQKKYRNRNKGTISKQQKEYYHIHGGEKYNKAQWIYYQKAEWYYSCVAELCCANCGLSFRNEPRLADFHHTTKSSDDIAALTALRHSYNRFCEELNKGIYLCPNCHRLEHLKEGKERCQERKSKLKMKNLNLS